MGYVYIPKLENLRADHPLREWLGDEDAEALCVEFGGLSLFPSKCKSLTKHDRNASIASDLKQGMSVPDAATKYRVAVRTIRHIRQHAVNDDNPSPNGKGASGS